MDRQEDSGADQALRYLEKHGPLRAGERATLFRFWMDAAEYQTPSPCQSLIFVQIVRHSLTTPKLAATFVPVRDPDFWFPVFSYAALNRAPDADYAAGSASFGVYTHDWRLLPPQLWLEMLAEREELVSSQSAPAAKPSIHIFSEDKFDQAVRRAFKDCLSTEKLRDSALLASRIVVERVAESGEEPVRALQEVLKEAALTLRTHSDDQKLFRALRACYFETCASQEAAAEKLEIGIATLRRHLKEATVRVVQYLWAKETGA